MKKILNEIPTQIKNMKPYQAGKTRAEVSKEFGVENIVKLASNENHLGPAPAVISTIKEEAQSVFLYPDSASRDLKKALAEKHNLNQNQIFTANGSDEIIDLLMTLILTPGDEVIQADPAFIKYELAVKSRGGSSIKVPLDQNYRHDLKAMAAEITEQTKVIFICNPNNPTGTMVSKREIKTFLEQISEEILVIVDQAYLEYITADSYFDGVDLLAKHSNLMLLRTFSKAYALAGMRVGYCLGNEKILEELNKIRGPFNVNRLAQKAALQALKEEKHLKKAKLVNKKEKEFLYQQFEQLALDYIKTQANFIMVDTAQPAADIFRKLQQRGVIIRPANQFGLETWIRVTVGSREENEIFINNLREILAEGE